MYFDGCFWKLFNGFWKKYGFLQCNVHTIFINKQFVGLFRRGNSGNMLTLNYTDGSVSPPIIRWTSIWSLWFHLYAGSELKCRTVFGFPKVDLLILLSECGGYFLTFSWYWTCENKYLEYSNSILEEKCFIKNIARLDIETVIHWFLHPDFFCNFILLKPFKLQIFVQSTSRLTRLLQRTPFVNWNFQNFRALECRHRNRYCFVRHWLPSSSTGVGPKRKWHISGSIQADSAADHWRWNATFAEGSLLMGLFAFT